MILAIVKPFIFVKPHSINNRTILNRFMKQAIVDLVWIFSCNSDKMDVKQNTFLFFGNGSWLTPLCQKAGVLPIFYFT